MIEWILVGIITSVVPSGLYATEMGRYENLEQCFIKREVAIAHYGGTDEYPADGMQFVCIKRTK